MSSATPQVQALQVQIVPQQGHTAQKATSMFSSCMYSRGRCSLLSNNTALTHLLNSLHEIQDGPPAHVHPVLDPSMRWNLKCAIACSLDVYVQAASNGTPCGCARLGCLHDSNRSLISMSLQPLVQAGGKEI